MNTSATWVAIAAGLLASHAMAATKTIDREHVFTARPGQKVTVDVSFHQVVATARPGSTVEVAIHLEASGSEAQADRALAALEPVFRDDGDTLLVRSAKKGLGGLGSVRVKGHVSVVMPPDMDLVVDSSSGSFDANGDFGSAEVVCDASSGSFTMHGAAAEVQVDLSSGSAFVDLTRPADEVHFDMSSGSVKLKGGARTVTADTSSGSINLTDLLGGAEMNSSSGNIFASWAAIPAGTRVVVEASSGNVTLSFPGGTEISGDAVVSSGKIHSDFPGSTSDRGRRLELAGGSGAIHLQVETSSGGVRLEHR